MQDFYRWVLFAGALQGENYLLNSEVESAQDTVFELESYLMESRKSLDSRSKVGSVLDTDISCYNSHLRLITKILYRKRRSVILTAVDLCTDFIKNYRGGSDSQEKLDTFYKILLKIKDEKHILKTSIEKKRFLKLKHAVKAAVALIEAQKINAITDISSLGRKYSVKAQI